MSTSQIRSHLLNGNLNCEAIYLNGIKNGFGKEYYKNGNLKFEGIYKDDIEWEGKGFNINGESQYQIKIVDKLILFQIPIQLLEYP